MIEDLADELSIRLVVNKIIPIEKRKYYTYGIELILHDLVIFLIVAAIAFITNTLIISAIFTFCFCLLRAYTGGYHSKSYAGCYITTMVNYLSLLVFSSVLGEYKLYAGWLMIILSIPVIWRFSPVRHKNNPFDEKEKNKYKVVARILVIIISLLFVVSELFLSDEIAFVLAWTMFATALLMLPAIILQGKEEISNEETLS
mgnify:CR=1 FL=1